MENEFEIELLFRSKTTGEYYFGKKNLLSGTYYIYNEKSNETILVNHFELYKIQRLKLELVNHSVKGAA